MIHCAQCQKEILHGERFAEYLGFAYCSGGCLYQYSLHGNNRVWYAYVRDIAPDDEKYDSVYADIEAMESTMARNVGAVLAAMRRCKT